MPPVAVHPDRMARPRRLVVVCGLPGVGKSTVAERAATVLDGQLVRTDVVRKSLVRDPTYDEVEDRRTYDAVLERARRHLSRGEFVVLDGTFRRAAQRERALAEARSVGAAFSLVRVTCPPGVVAERLAARTDDASDADFAVHRELRDRFESVTLPHETVRNTGPLDRTLREVDRLLGASTSPGRSTPPPSTD